MTMENIDPRKMTASQFASIQRRLGLSDRQLAEALGFSAKNGPTRIRLIKRGQYQCSEVAAEKLISLLDWSQRD